ncbi:hypothetical protein HELRODRAFT_182561 [Helobdella robusta]|uniref:Uncharacterized protein n=1 Tax=Helobdella robusta TaxID=6412 RepID=T1FIC6_HELRO|nr:hypothetical protein HELRODRAFT_182561 [Helobdella robusta]ESN90854.1 hypothetical protein HELRODRAFT_182561 [Helobdella robusta]
MKDDCGNCVLNEPDKSINMLQPSSWMVTVQVQQRDIWMGWAFEFGRCEQTSLLIGSPDVVLVGSVVWLSQPATSLTRHNLHRTKSKYFWKRFEWSYIGIHFDDDEDDDEDDDVCVRGDVEKTKAIVWRCADFRDKPEFYIQCFLALMLVVVSIVLCFPLKWLEKLFLHGDIKPSSLINDPCIVYIPVTFKIPPEFADPDNDEKDDDDDYDEKKDGGAGNDSSEYGRRGDGEDDGEWKKSQLVESSYLQFRSVRR